ncbi:Uncharacterised protein [Mycobacteroides abscessus subsp. abscessus]|nr:Uncharacterised protein [Mycobacteroides abscessus subsp. abscessus]SHY98256.1 Uncharacterised protein [Mycobacteroides abscessus subsp. abscessus]SKU00350.1 Uncharacterised protein [Mycobacteroides abscessus subsp. abscessus]
MKPRETSLRNSVCVGGSCMTMGGLSPMPVFSRSPYVTVSPRADENVSQSRAAS